MGDALGILVPEFPQQTHVFFWREIVALRDLGVDVALLSTRRPDPNACQHDFAHGARAETHYLFPPRAIASLGLMGKRARKGLALAKYVAGLNESSPKAKAKVLGLAACAADLAEHAARRGIRHIHAHSCADAAHVVAMAARLGGPSYSLTLHGDLPVYGTDHASKTERAVCMGCDGPHLKTQLIEKVGYPGEKVLPNWMGLDTSRFTERPRSHHGNEMATNASRSGEAGRLKMITVARLNRTKGHAHALRAMKRVLDEGCDVTYTLAGEGPYRKEVEAEIESLGLKDRVSMLGTQSEAQVLGLLQSHDVFVLPSIGLGEAGPISLMEAMSAGLPPIVSIIGSTPHMVEDKVSGFLVEQGDEAGLARHMGALCRDPALRQRVGEAARARAVEHFDVRSTTRRLLEFIEQHLGHRFARRVVV